MPATVALLLGPASVWAYLAAGGAAILIALSFAEAGSLFDRAGGPYIYAREAFGDFIGFEVGWMFLFGRMAGAAAIANAFAAYLAYFWPALAEPFGRAAVITTAITAIGALNYAGVRYGATVVNVLTIGKLVPLFLFLAAGLWRIDPGRILPAGDVAFGPLREASLILLFALGGFEFASVPSEEVVDSRRNLPIALILGIGFSAVVYVLAQVVCLAELPGLGNDPTPVASAARVIWGPAGAALMVAGAVLSTTGTNSTILLIGPRVLYALAQGGQLPAVFGRVHPRFRTPHVAVAVFAAATLAMALSGTFALLAALNAIARLLYSITTCAAVPVLRRKLPSDGRRFTLPFGALIPTLGIAASILLLTGITQKQALIGGAGLASGALVFFLARRPAIN
ncbi:MAG: amino acid permease [Bryobacter sp.]|jgi:amino acid transporter|nr:amino acid permease [Bryobacter sp.]